MPTNPQFLYMILVLPSLFGLTLMGDGLNKVFNEETVHGFISISFGVVFIGIVTFTFLFFSNNFSLKV